MNDRTHIAAIYGAAILANPNVIGDIKDPTFVAQVNNSALLMADDLLKRTGAK